MLKHILEKFELINISKSSLEVHQHTAYTPNDLKGRNDGNTHNSKVFWGQYGAHLGPSWAPCWPQEPCYLGYNTPFKILPILHLHQKLFGAFYYQTVFFLAPASGLAPVINGVSFDILLRIAHFTFNILRPRINGRHFVDDIFQMHFLEWKWFKILLNFVPKGRINNIPALVQILTLRQRGDKPLSEPMMA